MTRLTFSPKKLSRTCRTASELLATLDSASKSKTSLDAAVRSLAKSNRAEDADAVNVAMAECKPFATLLEAELKGAEAMLTSWKHLITSETKLAHVMRNGNSSLILGRAMQVSILVASQ